MEQSMFHQQKKELHKVKSEIPLRKLVARFCPCCGTQHSILKGTEAPWPKITRNQIEAFSELLEACLSIEPRLDRAGRGYLATGPQGEDRDWDSLKAKLRTAIAHATGSEVSK